MPNSNLNKFFLSIVLPSILAVILFFISFYVFVIPFFEKNMMDLKKEMILELTNTALSVLEEYQLFYETGELSIDDAKRQAAAQIKQMRYGPERKDYFWITDFEPVMIMHPYRNDLNGIDLKEYKDSHEKKLFTDAVDLVKKQDQGFIEYYWQWKDDTTRIVPKLSYVKGFKPWSWIVCTGIYLEDVELEIANLKKRLLGITSIILAIIIVTLIYVIRQSLNIENKRRNAEKNLWLSKQKYKGLVEASTEGTLMMVDNRVIFANIKFSQMINMKTSKIIGSSFDDIFEAKWEQVSKNITDPNKTINIETNLKKEDNKLKEVVISISRIEYSGADSIIIIVKDVSQQVKLEKEADKLSSELQTSLQMMNQPIKVFVKEIHTCSLKTPIYEVAQKMTVNNLKVIFVSDGQTIIGVVNDADIRKRIVAENVNINDAISKYMSAPISTIAENALLFEAILKFRKNKVSHLLVVDSTGYYTGVISNQDCLEMQRNSLSYMIKEIEDANQIDDLRTIYSRLPIIINSLIYSGDTIKNITRIITTVADAITIRVINMALDREGAPPCKFAFMVMGSEGRSEQTLKTDQDNAIVFDGSEETCQPYFLQFAAFVNDSLNYIGYKNCPGNVMAVNPNWCRSINVWKEKFSHWTDSPDTQNLLDSKIFFDFRFVFGEESLITELRNHLNLKTDKNSVFFYNWSQSIINYKPKIENNQIDLKKVLFPITGYIRIKALFNKLSETSSLNRLEQLHELGNIGAERAKEIEKMYAFLMQVRIKNQVDKILQNDQPENIIDLEKFSSMEVNTLKKILSELSSLQSELSVEFKGSEA